VYNMGSIRPTILYQFPSNKCTLSLLRHSSVSHRNNTVYLELRLLCSEMKQYGRNSTGDATGLLLYSRSIGSSAESCCSHTCFLFQHFISVYSYVHQWIAYCGSQRLVICAGTTMKRKVRVVDGRIILKRY
jgi:hypothetical protein